MSDIAIKNQPAACPICGQTMIYRSLGSHLAVAHQLEGRHRFPAMRIVWREVHVGLLGVTNPQWEGP